MVKNKGRGKTESDGSIQAYLVDGEGQQWEESRGVNGNRLTDRVVAGQKRMVSEPVFEVAADATGLGRCLRMGDGSRGCW